MFWKKAPNTNEPSEPKAEKLHGPQNIPDYVGRYLVVQLKKDPNWVWNLKAVLRQKNSKDSFEFRVFDDAQVATSKVNVKNYLSLDGHPDLTLYHGWYDKKSRQVQLED